MHYRTNTCSLAPLTHLCTDACTLTSTFSPACLCCHQSMCPIVVYACVTISSPIVQMNPQVADLGSAYKLAPQSPGLPQTERLSIGVLKSILNLRESIPLP